VNLLTQKGKNRLLLSVVNVTRFILAFTFIFSGFVKAIDPKGTAYKISDYFIYFHLDSLLQDNVALVLSICLACFEFLLGVYLFFGIRRKFTAIMFLLVMVLFTPFTLFLAIKNPVHDCGCFGDALVLTNWQTFWKNAILLLFAIIVFVYRKRMFSLISRPFHWAFSLYTIIFILLFCLYSIHYLPLFDFRPYKTGTNIKASMSVPAGAELPVYETTFIMQKDGKEKEFSLEEYPDSTWTYVKRKTVLVKPGYIPPITDFSISDEEGNDLTDAILSDSIPTFLLISPHFETADEDVTDPINSIYDFCTDHGYHFYGLTASDSADIAKWRYATGAVYPIYHADDVVLRTMVRSNPGLMLLKKGTILNKWSSNNLPLIEDGEDVPLSWFEGNYGRGKSVKVLLNIGAIYFMPLLFITLAHNLWRLRKKNKQTKKETS
jgi:uncharacterized membrane protein YphA (DoxX/SURF4 family)